MNAHTKKTQDAISPKHAINLLKEGNKRFVSRLNANRDLIEQVTATSKGQYPYATILSCIDSRVSAELIFDQGIGDIFSVRIAGNFVNQDILGSMEFACKLAGTKIIMVLGHTSCGAIKGACDDVILGNLTTLLQKIKPAVKQVTTPTDSALRNSGNLKFVDEVAKQNVLLTIARIKNESLILESMEDNGEIKIIGAMYNINTGIVDIY